MIRRISATAIMHKRTCTERPAAGYMLKNGTHPVEVALHTPSIRIDTVSGAKGVISKAETLRTDVNMGAR